MIVLEATFVLENKSVEEINETLDKRKERRMSTQPWNKPSAGSVFRNPEGAAAGNILMMQVLEVMKLVEHKFLQNILTLL